MLYKTGCFLAMCLSVLAPLRAQVVVNEIMYRPGSAFPENVGLEFIELHNTTALAVDVGGWALTSGVDFTFPAGASIPAGGYVVVASNAGLVQSTYGISGVFGPWVAGTSLSNSGEKITLSKPGAVAGTFDKIDSVTYAGEGDWGTRVIEPTFSGWDWTTTANGGNKSMELRNPAVSNDNGQNWSPSTAAAGATPGAANSVLTANVPPIIHGVQHSPAVPKSTDVVTISCDVTDEVAPQYLAATLFWRDATSASPLAFESKAMALNEATGKFSTTLGAMPNLAIVEFYVSVSDGVSTRTWPAPANGGQNANCQYQVTNEVLGATDAYYFLVLTGAENAAYNTTATSNSSSNRQFNTTLIVSNGAETVIRYRSQMRIRGNSSRSYQFKPLRVSIPNDDPWQGGTGFNLNPKASHLQFIGMRMMQAAGVRTPDSIPVRPRRNGVEYTTATGSTPDFGKWAREEDLDGDMVNNHWGDLTGGGIYKKVDNGGGLNYYWRSGQPAPGNPDTLLDGWGKQNGSSANDWSDLTSFFTVWQAAAKPHFPASSTTDVAGSNGTRIAGIGNWNSTALTAAEITSIETVSDLDQWARWFAVMTICQDLETKISNGVDDDYAVYFAPAAGGQRRMQLVAHDMDTILGQGDNPQASNYTGLYDMTEAGQSGYTFRTLLPLFGTAGTAGNAAFRAKYFAAIRDLYGTVLNADTAAGPNPPFYQFVDSHLTGWAPAATISAIKTFATARQTYLLGLIGSGATTPPAATSTATVTSAHGSLMISEILANNVAALNVGGTFPDIIELYNASTASIDLSGMSLTDDPAVKGKYVFPAGTVILDESYLIVYADSATGGGLHSGFALSQDGDTVQLYDKVSAGQGLLDSITFGLQAADYSIGRTGAALNTWALCTLTVGSANTAVAALAAPAGLRINEWAGNGDYLLSEDFVEIFNPSAQPVALGGMTITDDFINYPGKFALPQLSFAAPAAFLAFHAVGGSATDGNATELPFSIDANVGWLALIGQNGTIVDSVDVVAQPSDTSRGRSPNGSATIATFGLPTNVPTPGASNVTPPASVLALIAGLRISELFYKPTNVEFVELHNIGATTLDLAGVRFTDGIDYTFPAGVTLAPGAYIVVCKDVPNFQLQYGTGVPLAPGTFGGTLDNAGETITLRPPAPWDANILHFAYDSTWYPDTNNGYTLTVRDDVTTLARDWDQQSTWSASPAQAGTPGAASAPSITSTLTGQGSVISAFSYQITATKSPTSYNAAPLPPGLSVNTGTGVITGTPTQPGTFNVSISATNATGTGSRTLVLTITSGPPPVITSAGTAGGTTGTAFTYQIVATNSPTSYDATPLPAGLAINTSTGLISGTPTDAGTFNITLTATNPSGPGTKPLTLTLTLPAAPVLTSAGTASGVLGDAFTYQIIASGSPASYGATGLPAGLSVNAGSGLISGTPTGGGVSSVTLSATNPGGTGTKVLTLTVASSGPLTSFIWSAIASPQQVGVPFATTLTAIDSVGRTVTTFNGSVNLTGATPGSGTGSTVVITEASPNSPDYFEIQNVSGSTVNTTGWFVVLNDAASSNPNTTHTLTMALPASMTAGQILYRTDSSTDSYWGENIFWTNSNPGWAMVVDNTGVIRDFVAWGYSAAQVTSINFTKTVNSIAYTLNPGAQAAWTGAGITLGASTTAAFIRAGTDDHNTIANWSYTTASKGTLNAGLTLPFPGASVPVPITPSSVALVNGVFTGSISAGAVGTGVRVTANDGASHIGLTNSFDTVAPPAPVITSPTSAIAVIGQPFSYQILATNYIASYNAASLPAGLSVSTSTGLISGTPTIAATSSITVSATNFGGTGNATLSLQVQADTDGDGMGDAWESANGLTVGTNDALGDLDGDGQGNLAEWLAGTAPNSSSSTLRILSEQPIGLNMQLTWNAVVGRRYRVLTRTDLLSGTWLDLTPTPIVATATSALFTHSGGNSGAARFYRVEIVP